LHRCRLAQVLRVERLNGGAPFLNSHDAGSLEAVLGVVVDGSARIANGQGTATIRFGERADVEPIFRDGAHELWRAVDWEPLEISAVAIGADPGARVRSDTGATHSLNTCTLTRAIG
jgi:hypothetical protein